LTGNRDSSFKKRKDNVHEGSIFGPVKSEDVIEGKYIVSFDSQQIHIIYYAWEILSSPLSIISIVPKIIGKDPKKSQNSHLAPKR